MSPRLYLLLLALVPLAWAQVRPKPFCSLTGEDRSLMAKVERARDRARRYIINQCHNWGGWAYHAAFALTFLEKDYFFCDDSKQHCGHGVSMLIKESVARYLLADLYKNESYFLAWHINGILATCQDPQKYLGNIDVTALEQARTEFQSPFSLALNQLAVCNGGGTILPVNMQKVLDIIEQENGPAPWQDTKALAGLTLTCLKRVGKSTPESEAALAKAITYLKGKQKPDGSFGTHLWNNTLATEVLSANCEKTGWNYKKAILAVMKDQKPDGSFGNFFETYVASPILAGRTYVDLSSKCECPTK